MNISIKELGTLAKDTEKETASYLEKLKKKPPKQLDYLMQDLHDAVFKRVNCLDCANCCKTTGPLFTDADVERLSKFLKMKPAAFEAQYLRVDEEGDKVLKQVPCAFLADDNHCLVYEVRPKACREYPHTDRKKFYQINKLTMLNRSICPAAYEVVEALKKKIPQP
ncbi:MAG: zinc/iron-chelating domain-containing protein [Flavobacterium sp. BFFFF2]|nr:MAG: zinc/iron-chelating domain-containing protein [Flavobacterium sp. BFFFF2]